MNEIKISIITVSFNSLKTIEQTILSVLNQTYKNVEYIVVDGGSTDGTLEILKKYEPKFEGRMRWTSEPDKGIYDAMNKGVVKATGEWIEFIGSDDSLSNEDVLMQVSSALGQNNFPDILCAGVKLICRDSGMSKIYKVVLSKEDIYHGNMSTHQGMFTRRHLLLSHPFDLHYNICADLDFVLWCCCNNATFCFIELCVADFDTTGISSGSLNSFVESYKIRQKHTPQYKKFWGSLLFRQYIKASIRLACSKLGVLGTVRKILLPSWKGR